jgi:hypothetical protein
MRPGGRYVISRHGSHATPDTHRPDALPVPRPAGPPGQPAHPRHDDDSLPECWQIAEWPPGTPELTDYGLSTPPPDPAVRELVRLAKMRWRIEHDYRE